MMRRGALLLAGALALATAMSASMGARAQQPEDLALEADHAFRTFMESLWPEARAAGISRRTFERALAEVQVDWRVLEKANYQPEHEFSLGDYIGRLVSESRIVAGRERLAELGEFFRTAEGFYGVDRHVLLAIWGIESNYGSVMGEHGVIRALGMLAWKGERRAGFGRQQLLSALRIIEAGDIDPARMLGSWAGAMGHTQFIPTTYSQHAVDFDRDGRRDIWSTVPDALASTANYLKVSGWRPGIPWGVEVTLPQVLDSDLIERELTWAEWAASGLHTAVRPGATAAVDITSPDLATTRARLMLPAGVSGPAFLVTANFRALLAYNNATSYALAVGHLADRLVGRAGFVRAWPEAIEDRALNRHEREELQRLLAERGLYQGEADGLLGQQTKAALIAWQRRNGLLPDGYANRGVLARLRGETSRAAAGETSSR